LAHHATVLTTKGKSYRMRKRRTREEPSWSVGPAVVLAPGPSPRNAGGRSPAQAGSRCLEDPEGRSQCRQVRTT